MLRLTIVKILLAEARKMMPKSQPGDDGLVRMLDHLVHLAQGQLQSILKGKTIRK